MRSTIRKTISTSSTYQSKVRPSPVRGRTKTTISTRILTSSTRTRRKTPRLRGKTRSAEERTRT